MKEIKEFKTESKELLNLMINSIYSNSEIFLRELISNASDAIDKYKYVAFSSDSKYPQKDYAINLSVDKKNKTITISDNGIGMSKNDLVNNLGTIAKSGSKDFVKKFKEAKDNKDLDIIGQFGVGFYSAFMVAKKVEVLTRYYDTDKAFLFSSDGKKSYTIDDATRDDSGTTITIFLKDDTEEEKYSKYLEQYEIESLVKKYSDYIRFPIKMDVTSTVNDVDKDGKEVEGKTHEVVENKIINSMIPLWRKNKNEVSEKELNDFYKSKFKDYEDPLCSLFINVDGVISYNSLIFIPSHAPYNLYSENYEKGLDLYSKGIFVKEKCKELVPDYLKFIRGLVDSEDFSLNISREILQNSPLLKKIESNIEKKVVDKLKEIKQNDFEKFLKFYKAYGDHIKFGIYSTYGMNKDLLQDLILFKSLNNDKLISLKDYVDNMKEDQKYIYYVSGKTVESMKLLPQIEHYKSKGYDVLLCDGNIDEFTIMMMKDYNSKEFKSISDEQTNELNETEKKELDDLLVAHKRTIDNIKEALKGKVDDVTFSNKLIDSPVCISTKNGLSLNMEHVINEEMRANKSDEEGAKAIKVLEINPNHELFKAIDSLSPNDEEIKQYGSLLYDEAMLLEGYEVENKTEFVKKLNELMIKSIKVNK